MKNGVLYQCVDVGHPHEHSAFLCVLPHHLTAEVSAHKVNEDILTPRVKRPDDLTPRYGTLVSFAQHVLTEEQQEASSVIVNRSTMLLNHTDTLDNVC
jgi:hypothetical protein